MNGFFHKITFLQIRFFIFILFQIKSFEQIIEKKSDKKDDDDDRDPDDMMKTLQELKSEIQNLTKDIAKYDTLIYLLVPAACLLFLILASFSIYEIIKGCKKKPIDLIETNKPTNYVYSETISNSSKTKDSLKNSTNSKENQNMEVHNSITSSKDTDSNEKKNKLNPYANNRTGKENFKESKNIGESGYVAPSIEEIKNNTNQKYMTNTGDEVIGEKNNKYLPNPFLKE